VIHANHNQNCACGSIPSFHSARRVSCDEIPFTARSHQKANRAAADAKKDKALKSAGIRVLRWQVNSVPDEVEIKSMFAQAEPIVALRHTVDRWRSS
jgi:hypothetical protein